MFVQIIQGQVSDAAGMRRVLDRWVAELADGAGGWLGTTAGVSPEGEGILIARFASREAAEANGARPEQDAWWHELVGQFTGDPVVHDCSSATLIGGGGSDEAGFVQVLQSQVTRPEALDDLIDEWQALNTADVGRADLIGGLVARHDDGGGLSDIVWFTSEEEARAAETRPVDPRFEDIMQRWFTVVSSPRFIDLPDPWLASAS